MDILFERTPYARISELPIDSKFVPFDGTPVKVNVPSIEDLLGDKLTAFAPKTTGIPFFRGKDSMSMEIIKQLYDIGNLIDSTKDVRTVKDTFMAIAHTELRYRGMNALTPKDVLRDVIDSSLCICTRGKVAKDDFAHFQNGINRIKSFIFSENYHIEKAIVHASKAAYIAYLLLNEQEHLERFDTSINMMDWKIGPELHPSLNKLKKSSPESFFYWYQVNQLIPPLQNLFLT